jgi:hypothetical protein
MMDVLREFPAPAAVDMLKSKGVTHVSVNCALYVTGCEPVLQVLDRSSAFRLVSDGTWQGQPVKLYELVR